MSTAEQLCLLDRRGRRSLQIVRGIVGKGLPYGEPFYFGFLRNSIRIGYRIPKNAEGWGDEGEDYKECGYDAQRDKRRFR